MSRPRTPRSDMSSASRSSLTPSERQSWSGFVIAASTVFVLALSVTLPTALYSSYATRYGFGSGVLTLIFAAYVAGNLAVLLGLGGLGDHAGGGRSCSPRCSRQWPVRCCSSSPTACEAGGVRSGASLGGEAAMHVHFNDAQFDSRRCGCSARPPRVTLRLAKCCRPRTASRRATSRAGPPNG